jgi:hypothetical protein
MASDGLFAGMLAVLAIEIFIRPAGLAAGENILNAASRISPLAGLSPLSDILLHFAVSIVYGILFGLLYHWLANRREMLGFYTAKQRSHSLDKY